MGNYGHSRAVTASGSRPEGPARRLPVTMSLPARGRSAAPMNDIPKVVFSRTLRETSWPETRIASGDTALEIGRLKAEPGGDIVAHGGTQFVRSLVRLGLVDRYHST